MSEDHAAHIDKHVRTYMIVFGSLIVLTIGTVGAWKLHLNHTVAIMLALFIAIVKGSLVACFFMHLISEKKLVYWVLILTVVFFAALLSLPVLTSIADQAGI